MACVAGIDPALLAARGDAYSAFRLSRGNTTGEVDAHKLKTIGWAEALAILIMKDSAVKAIATNAKSVMETRNAATHIALADASDVADAVVRLAQVVGILHQVFPQTEDEYWGPTHFPVAQSLRDARATAVLRRYSSKVAKHAESFARMLPGFSASERETVFAAMETRRPWGWAEGAEPEHTYDRPCPACHRKAQVGFSVIELDDFEEVPQFDSDGQRSGTRLQNSIELVPLILECPVCGLELDSEEVELVPEANRIPGTQWMDLPWPHTTDDDLSEDAGT